VRVYRKRKSRQLPDGELTFDQGQAQVEAMMQQQISFSAVEDAIDAAPLPSKHKAALWLFAWSLRDARQQRRDAKLLLAQLSAEQQAEW